MYHGVFMFPTDTAIRPDHRGRRRGSPCRVVEALRALALLDLSNVPCSGEPGPRLPVPDLPTYDRFAAQANALLRRRLAEGNQSGEGEMRATEKTMTLTGVVLDDAVERMARHGDQRWNVQSDRTGRS